MSAALLAAGLFVGTFVLEDLALTTGAGLVAAGTLPLPLAAVALVAGIALGDAGLYGAGRLARSRGWFRSLVECPAVRRMTDGWRTRPWPLLIAARFVPGMRLPVYFASGLAGVRPREVASAIAIATCLWTLPILWFGAGVLAASGAYWPWLMGMALVAVLVPAFRRRNADRTLATGKWCRRGLEGR